MKKIFKQIIFGILYLLYRIRFIFRQPQVVVALMYHSISNTDWEFATSPEDFERQIKYLKDQDFNFIQTKDLKEWLSGEKSLSKKSVLITFDDGYKDILGHALPILKKYGAAATVFIHSNRRPDELGNGLPLLSWEEIREFREADIEIGDHSFSHPNLKNLAPQELLEEFSSSKHAFQEHLGFQPHTFVYPGGKFSSTVIEILKNNGYTTAFTIDRGLIDVADNPFRLKRFGVSRETRWLEFKARLTPVNNWYEFLIKLIP